MGGKYEIRFYDFNGNYQTIYTNSWFEFAKIKLTKNWIYFKIYKQ